MPALRWKNTFLPAAVAAAAKSLWSCPTVCDPVDGSPPGSPVPGILQARTLEWVAISFSNAWKWKVKVKSLSLVFFKNNLSIYLFLFFGWTGSLLACKNFLYFQQAGAAFRCVAWASHCGGFFCCGAQSLGPRASVVAAHELSSWGCGLQSMGSAVVAHRLGCSAACGMFLDQGWNPYPLHWQKDSLHCPTREVPLPSFFCLFVFAKDSYTDKRFCKNIRVKSKPELLPTLICSD